MQMSFTRQAVFDTVGQYVNSMLIVVQARLLAKRKLNSLLRHPWLLAFAFCATIATALLMSTVYSRMDHATPGIQNRFSGFFFVILYLSLVSLSSIPVWQSERGLFLRERSAGLYNTPAYVVTAVTADLLFMRMIPPLILGLIAYPLMGLRAGAMHQAVFCVALMLCNVAAAAMNMAIGAACSSTSSANMLGSIAVMVNVLFGGFLMSLHNLPHLVNVVAQASFARYAYNILAINEFKDVDGFMLTPFTPPGVDPKTLPHKDVTGNDILSIFYFDTNTIASDLFSLVAIAVFYVGLTALLLHTQR
jgi:ATP-binding cassette, subfamily G (WHITE), member 2